MRLLIWGVAAVAIFVIVTVLVPMLSSAVLGATLPLSQGVSAPDWHALVR